MMGSEARRLLLTAVCAAFLVNGISGQASVAFEEANPSVTEEVGSIEICIVVVQGTITTESRVTLNSFAQSATSGSDYVPFDDMRLTFSPGDTRMCANLTIRQDDTVEGTEFVNLTVSSTTLQLGSPSSVIVSILDSDRITVGFSQPTYTAVEGAGTINVCASRLAGSLTRPLSLTFTPLTMDMSAGNATSDLVGQDYLTEGQPTTLPAGALEVCVQFGSLDDNLAPILEEIEFYQITLTTDDSADVLAERSLADFFIEDNDGATIAIVMPTITIVEDMTPIDVCIVLRDIQSGLMRELRYTLTVNLGTASNDDFEAPSIPTITFPPDSVILTEMCVQYQIIDDVYKEFDETLTITVVPEHSFDNIDGPSEVSITIIDDMDLVQFCELLTDPPFGAVNTTDRLENTTAGYSCIRGYILNGTETRVCQRNADTVPGDWTGEEPICEIVNCGDPPSPNPFSDVNFTDTTYLSNAVYSCDTCYEFFPLVTTVTLVCQETKMWSPSSPPECQLVDCGSPPEISDCEVAVTMTTCNSEASYSPADPVNFTIFGDTTLQCQPGRTWQPNTAEGSPQCLQRGICPAPPNPIDGDCGMVIQRPNFTSVEAGAVATYGCPIGCVLNTTMIERTCEMVNMTFGEWSGVTPTCNLVMCPTLANPPNGTVSNPSVDFQAEATYTCVNDSFYLDGPATRICQADGQWSDTEPSCIIVECPPLSVTNGNVMMTGINPGDNATYECDMGFTLVGNETRVCTAVPPDGVWSGEDPMCFMDCGEDDEVINLNGTQDSTDMTHDSTVNFTCTSDMCNYTRICNDGTWGGDMPSCDEPRCENLSLSSNENLTIVHDSNPIAGTLAVYNCTRGLNGTIDTRMCGCNGMWSQPVPRCREPEPEPEESDDFPIGIIIGIAVAAAILLLILLILLICCIAFCIRSRKNKRDKQYENYYRDFMRPYTTPYNSANPDPGATVEVPPAPQPEKTMPQWERDTVQAESILRPDNEDDDDLPSPTPSDENMEEYRLRLHDVETQSTGSQHRIKPQIVAEKVEVEI